MRGRPTTIRSKDLLDAAREAFRKEGFAATTASIAKHAGVSEGILFHRYKTKAALLAAVIERETRPPEALVEFAARAGRGTVAANLRSLVGMVLDTVSRVHPFIELAETSPRSAEVRRSLFSRGGKPPPELIVDAIGNYLDAEARLGRMRRVDPVPPARILFGGCIDFVRSRRFHQDTEEARGAFIRGVVDVLVRGVVANRKAGRRS